MATPEGKVKDKIKKLLKNFNIVSAKNAGGALPAGGWYFMPVGGPYAVKGIPDFIGHYKGFFFGVEAKAPGKKPTGFQALQLGAIDASGGKIFVVDGDLTELKTWLEEIE